MSKLVTFTDNDEALIAKIKEYQKAHGLSSFVAAVRKLCSDALEMAFQRVNFHLNFHKTSTPPLSRGAKKRKLISQLPLENRLICKGFILLEVALQRVLTSYISFASA